jgi:hypothetical protein
VKSPKVICLGVHLLDVLVQPSREPKPAVGWEMLDDLRITAAGTAAGPAVAIGTRATAHGGTFHQTAGQLGTFGQQLRKRGRDARDEVAGRVRRDGTGRDHGYPGGRQRPPRFDTANENMGPRPGADR